MRTSGTLNLHILGYGHLMVRVRNCTGTELYLYGNGMELYGYGTVRVRERNGTVRELYGNGMELYGTVLGPYGNGSVRNGSESNVMRWRSVLLRDYIPSFLTVIQSYSLL